MTVYCNNLLWYKVRCDTNLNDIGIFRLFFTMIYKNENFLSTPILDIETNIIFL